MRNTINFHLGQTAMAIYVNGVQLQWDTIQFWPFEVLAIEIHRRSVDYPPPPAGLACRPQYTPSSGVVRRQVHSVSLHPEVALVSHALPISGPDASITQ